MQDLKDFLIALKEELCAAITSYWKDVFRQSAMLDQTEPHDVVLYLIIIGMVCAGIGLFVHIVAWIGVLILLAALAYMVYALIRDVKDIFKK